MDEVKIVSKFTRGVISKILTRTLCKKLGYEVGVQLNNISVTVEDGKTHIHLDADAELEKGELIKILTNSGLY